MRERNRGVMLAAAAGLAMGVAGAAQAQVRSWAAPVSGSWTTSGNWSPADVPNSTGESALLGLTGPYTVSLTSGLSVGGVTLANPDAVLDIVGTSAFVYIYGAGLENQGLVNVATNTGTNAYARLSFQQNSAPMALSGSGVLRVSAGANASTAVYVANGVTLVQAPTHTIAGHGRLDMNVSGVLWNEGLIVADDPGAVLTISGEVRQAEGKGDPGRILADGGIINTDGLKLHGGTLASANGGLVRFDGNTYLYGPTLQGAAEARPDSSPSYLYGSGLVNEGVITVAPHPGTGQYARLSFQETSAPMTLSGPGVLRIDASGNASTHVAVANGVTLVHGPDHTIAGNGRLDMNVSGVLRNEGLIVADSPVFELNVQGEVRQEEGGGSPGMMIADGGTLSTAGLKLHGGILGTANGGRVVLDGSTYLYGPTLVGDIAARANSNSHYVYGTGLVNNGTITVGTNPGTGQYARLHFNDATAPMVLDGTGEVRLAGNGNSSTHLGVSNTVTLVHGATHTIAGNGRINVSVSGRLHNEGLIVADEPGAVLDIEGSIYQEEGPGDPGMVVADGGVLTSSGMKLHGGTLTAMNGGVVRFGSNTELHGVALEALPGGLVEFGGTMRFTGTVFDGEGAVRANSNSHFVYGTGLTNHGTILVETNPGTGQYTRLHFNDSAAPMVLDGTGRVRLNANGNSSTYLGVAGSVTLVNGPDHTISGEGRIDVSSVGRLHNEGLIVADEAGGVLDIDGPVYQEEGPGAPGRLVADGGVLSTGSLRLHGGTLEGVNGGEVRFDGSTYLYGVTLEGAAAVAAVGNSYHLYGDGLTNNGTIHVATNPGTGQYARLHFSDTGAPMVLDGTGRLRLSGNGNTSTYLAVGSGVTLVNGGDHAIVGEGRIDVASTGLLQNDAILSPGDEDAPFGAISLSGPLAMGPTSEFRVGLGGTNTALYDRLTGTGSITLGGTLRVEYVGGYAPVGGDEFVVLTGSNITGEFDTLDLPRRVRVEYHPTMVKVIRSCDGDFTNDGDLNVGDFTAFRNAYLAGNMIADFNEDGVLSVADFVAFRAAYLGFCN